MVGRQVTIEFIGNSRSLVGAMDSADSHTHRLGASLKRIGKAAALGFAAATVVAAKGLYEMGQAAADDEASAAQLARQLKNNTHATKAQTDAVEDWILKQELASGVADDDLRPALARLATATGKVHKAQELLTLGMNISAGTGKDLKTVTEALAKAQNGNLGGLSRLGVKIKDAAGETKSFAAIQDDLAKKFRGATAEAADTTAGKMARLKVQMHEAAETIGYALLPYATRFADWAINKGIPAVKKIGDWFQQHLAPAIKTVVGWFSDGAHKSDDLSGAMKDLKKFTDDVKRAWVVFGPLVKDAAQNYFPLLVTELKFVAKGLRLMGDVTIFVWNNMIAPQLRFMLRAFQGVTTVVGDMMSALGHVPGFGWAKKLGNDLKSAGDKAGHLASEIRDIPDSKHVTITIQTVNTGGNGRNDIPLAGGQSGRQGSGNPAVQVGAAALEMVQNIIAAIGGKKKKIKDVLAGIADAISQAKDNIKSLLEDKKAWADGFQDFVTSVFAGDFTDPATGAYTGTVDSIISYQEQQLQKALQLQADMQKLIQLGLSPALLGQLQAAGASGANQIHSLAGATSAQIQQLNALNQQTANALQSAGQEGADVVFKDQLQVANQQLNQLQAVNAALSSIAQSLDKDQDAVVRLEGQTLEIVFRRREKATGRKLLVSPA